MQVRWYIDHVGQQARRDINHAGTQVRWDVGHIGTQARMARDLANWGVMCHDNEE